jgi:hypothetical protein
MKSAILTFEAEEAPGCRPVGEGPAAKVSSRKDEGYADYYTPRERDGNVVFAWSVIGFTSTLMAVGFALFVYAFAHLL